jgi:hypothetical protein
MTARVISRLTMHTRRCSCLAVCYLVVGLTVGCVALRQPDWSIDRNGFFVRTLYPGEGQLYMKNLAFTFPVPYWIIRDNWSENVAYFHSNVHEDLTLKLSLVNNCVTGKFIGARMTAEEDVIKKPLDFFHDKPKVYESVEFAKGAPIYIGNHLWQSAKIRAYNREVKDYEVFEVHASACAYETLVRKAGASVWSVLNFYSYREKARPNLVTVGREINSALLQSIRYLPDKGSEHLIVLDDWK